MKIYQDSGYINIRGIIETGYPFIFVVGGRATGKTYTILETVVEDDIKFMFMRRTQAQADVINKPQFSPYKSLNADKDWDIGTQTLSKYNAGFYHTEKIEDKVICVGEPLGYTCALSTISNVRGFDASDVKLFIYDEFMPEKHERPIKNEAMALFNAYETICRNRELKGEKPVQLLCLSNSNDMANPIFLELGLIRQASKMKKNIDSGKKAQEIYTDEKRGILLIILDESPISARKANTALYRLTAGSDFAKMSLDNDFYNEEIGNIKSKPLKEYKPVVAVGEICIYKHKAQRHYYVSTHTLGTPVTFGVGDMEKSRFKRNYSWIWEEYIRNNIVFEEYLCEILLTKYFN